VKVPGAFGEFSYAFGLVPSLVSYL